MDDASGKVRRVFASVGAVAAAAAWQRERRRTAAAEQTAAGARHEREEIERELRRTELALARERQMVARLQQSRRAERAWNRELREQLQRLYAHPPFEPLSGDVRALVLEAACGLLQAEKGLMLASTDADGDGRLDVALSRGFENDPADSAIAQRFARKVLERDETIRESMPAEDSSDEHELTPADREIDDLVAIPVYMRDRFHGVVVCANRPGGFRDVDDDLLLALGDHAGAALHTGHLRMDLREAHQAGVHMLLEALSARDVVLHRESVAVAALASSFAEVLDLDAQGRETLVLATLLRDVGYLALPERTLVHAGPLSIDERAVVELHPRIGFAVLLRLPVLRDVAYGVLYHHEHFDGSGYPYGLSGDDVPVTARAVALLDAFASMTHDRPFRRARAIEAACQEIADCSGTQFDPELAALFIEHVRRQPEPDPDTAADGVLDAMTFLPDDEDPALLGVVTAAETDPLTLLGGHRAFRTHLEAAVATVEPEDVVLLAMVQLEEVARLNEEASHLAGDRLIQAAARAVERAAGRVAGTPFRISGRRLAVVANCAPERVADVIRDIELEFVAGPTVRTSACVGGPGADADELVGDARAALREAAA